MSIDPIQKTLLEHTNLSVSKDLLRDLLFGRHAWDLRL